jgi:3-dehydroquinate synthase
MKILNLDLKDRGYPIYIGQNLLADKHLFSKHILSKKVCVVTNETVADLYMQSILEKLSGFEVMVVSLKDGEKYKNEASLNQIYEVLLKNRADRDTTIVALGGGVVGDISGYAAATYMRGIPFIQVPTTLLSQVDSSVGGKTGINHALGKNMIGAFYQPKAVIIDLNVLNTLPKKELSAGLAEVIKYGLIWDIDFFIWLEQNMKSLLAIETDALSKAIYRSCEIKAEVVAQDEKEKSLRAILNLGHTFGHAIETNMGYGNWLHGEAVATGMLMAAKMSKLEGFLSHDDVLRIEQMLMSADLPISPPQLSIEKWLDVMRLDKKNKNDAITLVLMEKIGKAIITASYNQQNLENVLVEAS